MKNYLTNGIALLLLFVGLWLDEQHLTQVGSYAFSGAITNWLAVHMLFEKVPGLYGSGIIPNRFTEFKDAIKKLIMGQFFTQANIEQFFKDSTDASIDHINVEPLLDSINYDELFQGLVNAVMNSSMGAMVAMVGGPSVFDAVKDDFIKTIRENLKQLSEKDHFKQAIAEQTSFFHPEKVVSKVEQIIDQRLEELTPNMVKLIIQQMIKEHLGWLVVWGGVFGGLIGLILSFK